MLFKKKRLTKRCSVYISEKHRQIIVTPHYVNRAGIIYEQEKSVILDRFCDAEELGTAVIDSLNLYCLKEAPPGNMKLTDWPSFKQGRSSSVRVFEQEYIRITVDCRNGTNLFLTIEGHPYKDSELTIHSTVSFHADRDEIGKRIVRVHEACVTGKL